MIPAGLHSVGRDCPDPVGGPAYTHDARGNLIDAGSRKFCYDLENRLTHVRMNSGPLDCGGPTAATHRFTYDPRGRLKTFEVAGVRRDITIPP